MEPHSRAALPSRIAELPPDRRQLLEKLLEKRQNRQRPARPSTSMPSSLDANREVWWTHDDPKTRQQGFYNSVNSQLNATEFGEYSYFLNFGYAPNGDPSVAQIQLPPRYLNKNSVRLVLELIGDCEVGQQRVLDVGCGRGGTLSVFRKFFTPDATTGLDLSFAAVQFCAWAHRESGSRFVHGDAEVLPFRDESFGIVTNIESSHSYPEIDRFYREVRRVLVPGGHFLYTDILETQQMARCEHSLETLGFAIERAQDITKNVLLSCDEIAASRTQAFQSNDNVMLDEFLGAPGSDVYLDMREGRCVYKLFKLRKVNGHQRG